MMNFGLSKREKIKQEVESHSRLQMYKIPPTHTISLEDFETIAAERLKRKWIQDNSNNFICL